MAGLPTILAIETSLDDTCAAVTRGTRVLSNIIASQVDFHADYGGTVPDIAKRTHMEWIEPTIDEALIRARRHLPTLSTPTIEQHDALVDEQTTLPRWRGRPSMHRSTYLKTIDAVAVTYGPGLAPALEVGILAAKRIALQYQKPLIGVNHMEGHLLSVLAANSKGTAPLTMETAEFPLLSLLISGGHTQLVLVRGMGEYEIVGETLDDAAGEAYDKVARMLQLGYPGGPILSELAQLGEPRYPLPEPMMHRADLHFSFSGLKTAARYFLEREQPELTQEFCQDFAASFEAAVIGMIERRLARAMERYQPRMLWLGGGVVSNLAIRAATRRIATDYGIRTYIPYSERLYTDNAAMIGVAGYFKYLRGEVLAQPEQLERVPGLRLSNTL